MSLTSMTIHRVTSVGLADYGPYPRRDNGNAVTLAISAEGGLFELTLFSLPDDKADALVAALAGRVPA